MTTFHSDGLYNVYLGEKFPGIPPPQVSLLKRKETKVILVICLCVITALNALKILEAASPVLGEKLQRYLPHEADGPTLF